MTILDVFGGHNYTISSTDYCDTATMHVPGRFWRRPHDKQIRESWTSFEIKDKRTSRIVFSVHCSTQLINIKIYVNNKMQDNMDFITRNNVLHDVRALYSLQKQPMDTYRLRANRNIYTQIYNALQK